MSEIYEIVNKVNGHIYIGSSINFDDRKHRHINTLNRKIHHNSYLQHAWNKYGEESFEFRPLIICDKDMLLYYEQVLLDAFQPEYNICKIVGSRLGIKSSPETRKKLSEAFTGRTLSEEHKRKLSIAHIGKVLSDEHKEKIRQSTLGLKSGKVLTEDHKKKISNAMKGKPSPKRGIHLSESHKNNVRIAMKRWWADRREKCQM